ncbi:MAG: hypothetical protein E6I33_08215 [Chloroflexi bacterium]|nr:MAG: hypothetical protein E6I55_09200 [Chloroflexota bacterium]TMF14854.1 MAG: hypothetical protein E6I33_08215 [Chloroflexota bacterium]
MNTMLTIAELLAGEALVSPGGPVDRVTAAADDYALVADKGVVHAAGTDSPPAEPDAAGRPLVERVLLPL